MSLLLALTLVLSEQSYGPYARPVNGGDVAVAPARGGALLAWSEAGRIHTGVLDTHARLGEGVHTFPATSERAIAVAPAAASNGTSFLVAWLELGPGGERVTAMLAGIDGAPAGTLLHYGPAVPVASNQFTLRVLWDGAAYRLWASGKMFTIGSDGNVLASADVSPQPHGVAARNRVLGTSTWRTTTSCWFGGCSRRDDLAWTVGATSGSLAVATTAGPVGRVPAPVLSPSAMAAAQDRFAIAWAVPVGMRYLVPGEGDNLVSASPETSVQPGLACEDALCVIAYGQSGDVHALAFPIDRLTGPELSTIAASERTERVPQVHALGKGRFLVIYRSDGFGGSRLNWRIMTFDTPRRRAVR